MNLAKLIVSYGRRFVIILSRQKVGAGHTPTGRSRGTHPERLRGKSRPPPPHRVESEIVMADGDYATETDTLKLMKR